MLGLDSNCKAFLALVRAGLWEQEVRLSPFGKVDYMDVCQLAEEQSVIGLVAAGIEHVQDVKIPQEIALTFVSSTIQLEQRNLDMNDFVAETIEKLTSNGVYALLVKGQGIAQCYERPLWRASGDVDLLLDESGYELAKKVLIPLARSVEQEYKLFKHIGMVMDGDFVVELHGTLHSRLSKRVDSGIDNVQNDVFGRKHVRAWQNEKTKVFLPAQDDDVIFLFTHILHHFYIEGVGLRQICDWCRFLWTYRDTLNVSLLEQRLRTMGLISEWRAFAALAVDWLGMPVEAMPLYSTETKWSGKAERIMAFVLETGSFGHNRQTASGKINSAWSKMKDFGRHVRIFPKDSVMFFFHFLRNGIEIAISK